MLENASPLETYWTLTASVGLAAAAVLLVLVVGDEIRRRGVGVGGVLRLELWEKIGVALTLCVFQGAFALAGLIQMQIPPRPDTEFAAGAAVSAFLIPMLFIVANFAGTLCAVGLFFNRWAINREIDRAVQGRRSSDKAIAS